MIPKRSVQEEAEKQVEAATKALEERIDAEIRRKGNPPIYVDIGGVPKAALLAVKRKYENGGWTVEEYHDQRDGSSIVLK